MAVLLRICPELGHHYTYTLSKLAEIASREAALGFAHSLPDHLLHRIHVPDMLWHNSFGSQQRVERVVSRIACVTAQGLTVLRLERQLLTAVVSTPSSGIPRWRTWWRSAFVGSCARRADGRMSPRDSMTLRLQVGVRQLRQMP